MRKVSTRNLVLTGLFIALGLVLPFLTGQIPSLGSRLLPMHIPVMLVGFICGWPYGLFAGFIVPLLRSVLLGMPPMFPRAVAMAFELAVYGYTAGFFYKRFPKKIVFIYLSLILSMICGRIVWGAVSYFLYGLSGTSFTWGLFTAGVLINAVPGIIIQLILIPVIIIALQKGNLIKDE